MNDPDASSGGRDGGNWNGSANALAAGKSSHDPACDECRARKIRCNKEFPKCSNCVKANLPCEFSNKGKRVNHTKKLIDDVELLGSRLGKIEDALFRCLSAVETFSSNQSQAHLSASSTSPDSRPQSQAMDMSDDDDVQDGHGSETSVDGSQPDQYYLFVGDHGYERFYGLSSMFSLYAEAQAASAQLMTSLPAYDGRAGAEPSASVLRMRLQEATELFQAMAKESPAVQEVEAEEMAPGMPPRALMEAFLHTYTTDLNPLLPIFDHRSILKALEEQYDSPNGQSDLAWITSFNHILLQTLAAKLNASRKSGLLDAGSLEDGFISHLLLNAKRCYNNFHKLLKPRLVNVQALFSLSLTALKYFRFTVFETVFAQACQLSKSIGLHQAISRQGPTDNQHEAERQNLFWSLFIVDKHVSLLAGKPCLLPSYDCSVPQPTTPGQFTARVQLAHIQEEIYRGLYSADVRNLGRESVNLRGQKLGRRLQSWAAEQGVVLSPIGSESVSPVARYCATELKYGLGTCWVLIKRRTTTTRSKRVRLQHARENLALFMDLCEGYSDGDGVSGFAVFENVCVYYSMISFLEVYIQMLDCDEWENDQDCELLSYFAGKAECLAAKTLPGSYSSKIKHVTGLCNQIANSFSALKATTRSNSPSSAAPAGGMTMSTGRAQSQSSTSLHELRTPSGNTSIRDPFWDVYSSFPAGISFETEKMLMGDEAHLPTGNVMDSSNLFLTPQSTMQHMMPRGQGESDDIMRVFSGSERRFGESD